MFLTEKQKKIALFRFGVITPLIGTKKLQRGQREKIIEEIISKKWEIPYSSKTSVSKATLLNWIKIYEKNNNSFESLVPKNRMDKGKSRIISNETELALVNLRKENSNISLAALLELSKIKNIIPYNINISMSALYKIIKKHIDSEESNMPDRRKFEAELPNDLWQTDCMHGPYVNDNGKMRKTYLFAIIDDHSRIITHAQFYFKENIVCFLNCLKQAFIKRGIPRKLYTDNGACFKSARLEYTTASVGCAVLHAKPYSPEGKGKIERWFKTVRTMFIPFVKNINSIDELNKQLNNWINNTYHTNKHSSINTAPIKKYTKNIHLIRSAPKNIDDYFRIRIRRKVFKDRSLTINGKLFEAPVSLIGKAVNLYYLEDDTDRVEVFYNEKSYGYLVLLNPHINSRIIRDNYRIEFKEKDTFEKDVFDKQKKAFSSGKLFSE
ncbi:MAG: DDE-type integrase/transposase/recombinase [Candidatus Muirbacterium halophilum]|jgi:transposase InsO family protein|nr:DDE-type integrase/transposase/recombinase [Candidatus Muirbacterium halophilum]